MSYYQYIIYDYNLKNAYDNDGALVETSNLYTTIEYCNAEAQNRLNELQQELNNNTGDFDYVIYELPIVK